MLYIQHSKINKIKHIVVLFRKVPIKHYNSTLSVHQSKVNKTKRPVVVLSPRLQACNAFWDAFGYTNFGTCIVLFLILRVVRDSRHKILVLFVTHEKSWVEGNVKKCA